MGEDWKILMAAGVPYGAPRTLAEIEFDDESVRAAFLRTAGALDTLNARQRDALLAWLCGFRRHWPSRFVSVLGEEGQRVLALLEALGLDDNRHIKLRRIAIENLAARI